MNDSTWQFDVVRPWWLAAVAAVPLLIYFWRLSLVHFARRQRTASLAIRLLLVGMLILALCGLEITGGGPQQFVLLPADASLSAAVVIIAAKPRVLLIASRPVPARRLAEALKHEHVDVEVRPPEEMPEGLSELRSYDLLILSNVPATSLPGERMDVLRRYVGQFGGGLIVIGGDRTFTPGGYRDSVLEEILPVACDVKKDKPKPTLAMVLLIDRSASMEGQSIELAKQATRRAVERLGPRDQVGVIAFEDNSRWVSPILPCSDKQQVLERIDTITAGGGTNLYPAMEKAYLALSEAFADLKHIIVLSDGLSHPDDFEALAGEIGDSGITVSTVAVGRQAAVSLLKDVARLGHGHFYFCDDPAAVPRIFAMETVVAGKVGITEEPFRPKAVDAAEIFAGLDFGGAPALLGYVETRLKPDARLALATDQGDPLLAWWRYGSGTSVVFTSDVQSRWAAAWLGWPKFGRFWAGLVRHAMRRDRDKDFVLHVERSGDRAVVILDALDPEGRFLNAAEAILTVVAPDRPGREMTLPQVAPGRYAAELSTPWPGNYSLEVTLRHDGRAIYAQHLGLFVGNGKEFRVRPTNHGRLQAIAKANGGRYDPKPAEVFAPSDTTAVRTRPLWPYLLAAAALLLVIDVALKRVDLARLSSK